MIAYPVPSLPVARAGEDVKANFGPRGEPLRNFDSFMERVLARKHSVDRFLAALEGEVRVQLKHGVLGRDGFRTVDLDFVIALGNAGDG